MTGSSGLGPDGTVYLDAYLGHADTHWFGMSCVPCGRVQPISVSTAIRLAGTGATFGELQRRLKCMNCSTPTSMVVCSDSRPASTCDCDGPRPETLGR
jgi:hypothetical protein